MDDINPYLPVEERALIKDQLLTWRNEGLFTPPTLRGTVQTPGDQGGSNWGSTASNPSNGTVYVLGVNAPAVIRLAESAPGIPAPNDAFGRQNERPEAGAGRGGAARAFAGRTVFTENCQLCHGADLKGGTAPSLADINSKMGMDAVRTIVQSGKDAMPSFSKLSPTEIDDLMAYLANATAATAGGARGAAASAVGGIAVGVHADAATVGEPGRAEAALAAHAVEIGAGTDRTAAPAVVRVGLRVHARARAVDRRPRARRRAPPVGARGAGAAHVAAAAAVVRVAQDVRARAAAKRLAASGLRSSR